MTEAERLADYLEKDPRYYDASQWEKEAAAELRRLVSFNQQLMDEVARLNQSLTWEQNRSGRIGTHGPGCHTWGSSHYECLLRVNQELLEALQSMSNHYSGSLDYQPPYVALGRAAIAKAQP